MPRAVLCCALGALALAGCAPKTTTTDAVGAGVPMSTTRTRVVQGGAGRDGSVATVDVTVAPTLIETMVAVPMDSAWKLLPAVYAGLGVPLTRKDDAQFLLGNDGLSIRRRLGATPLSRYLECGIGQNGPNADDYQITLYLSTQLRPEQSGGATVVTSLRATGRSLLFATGDIECSSKGTLERRIGSELSLALVGK